MLFIIVVYCRLSTSLVNFITSVDADVDMNAYTYSSEMKSMFCHGQRI